MVLIADLEQLKAAPNPVQDRVDDVDALFLGLGASAPANLAWRKLLGYPPGPPFAGLGFIDPSRWEAAKQKGAELQTDGLTIPGHVTAERVRAIKLREFERCADKLPSMYFWAMHPIYTVDGDSIVASEILVRARNGSDSAPFEDLHAIMDSDAAPDARSVYLRWVFTLLMDWAPMVLSAYPVFQGLRYITMNLRPLEMVPGGSFFKQVSQQLASVGDEERRSLLGQVVIEVTEDQQEPDDMGGLLAAWKQFGFKLAYDDTIGDLAQKALGQGNSEGNENFHTISRLEPVVQYFDVVKVDTEWAGYTIFLSHPSYARSPDVKTEILSRAREEDRVYVPQSGASGPGLRNTQVAYSSLVAEFGTWCQQMIRQEKRICLELTINIEDENNAFALAKLRDMGVDIFGMHKANFCMQGGPTFAKAFEPAVLAAALNNGGDAAGPSKRRKV